MNNFLREGPSITQLEIDYVNDALKQSSWYEKPYKYLEEFERDFPKYAKIDRDYCLMTSNCTTAIYTILKCLNIGPGDEVIVPDLTWVATASPIIQVGATPVLCDVNPRNWCLDLDQITHSLSSKTKAIIVVDLYGNMRNWERLEKFCKNVGIYIIEDAAEALGSHQYHYRAGSYGIASVFSFHRTKTICCGEGGAIVTNNKNLYEKCYRFRNHGRDRKYSYEPEESGFKALPSNMTAALALAQLHRLDELLKIKENHYKYYKENLGDIFKFNQENGGYWITACVYNKIIPTSFFHYCSHHGLNLRRFFFPLSKQKGFEKYKNYNYTYPNSNSLYQKGFNLPGAYILEEKELSEICNIVRRSCDKTF